MCRPLTCFVEYEDQLYAVFRYVMERVRPDGSYVNPGTTVVDVDFPHKTVGFHVYKTKLSALKMYYMERGSIDGLAMFIGRNHSFALSARDYPELKPDSIYYTEAKEFVGDDSVENYGGHDVGIFNYRDKTFSSCYYPCDVQSIKRIVPAPMWFTPSPF
ncbi:hypothetical protein PHJA_001321200 [Phtheirospermum japonicum]|uniref:KIB1-4 beta-propeller domain-containing protein n=1 Tax=Phtheirospermum japonicum TaxID=374723 RepID=A0A830C0T4_9LAMI|nr:hypothetical protein PHJA_001321200 [Phtheirospermum japonicum]